MIFSRRHFLRSALIAALSRPLAANSGEIEAFAGAAKVRGNSPGGKGRGELIFHLRRNGRVRLELTDPFHHTLFLFIGDSYGWQAIWTRDRVWTGGPADDRAIEPLLGIPAPLTFLLPLFWGEPNEINKACPAGLKTEIAPAVLNGFGSGNPPAKWALAIHFEDRRLDFEYEQIAPVGRVTLPRQFSVEQENKWQMRMIIRTWIVNPAPVEWPAPVVSGLRRMEWAANDLPFLLRS